MIYHVFNRSIADFVIFNNEYEYLRMLDSIRFYQIKEPMVSFSRFDKIRKSHNDHEISNIVSLNEKEKLIDIIAYCLMPTHIHLILQDIQDNGISIFIGTILNSYARYFNIKHNRKGPLWEGRYKKVLVKSDDQLLHLTRYIHLNPVTAYIVSKPEEWPYSSYKEYISSMDDDERICNYKDVLDITTGSYKEFVEDGISYQRDLAKIKALALE